MGLKQNTVLMAQLPLRHIGGDPGTLRPMWGRTEIRNIPVGEAISKLGGIPDGHSHPSSWMLPYRAGQIASRNIIFGSASLSATGSAVQALQNISATISAAGSVSASIRGSGVIAATISVNVAQASAAQIADAVWSKTLP